MTATQCCASHSGLFLATFVPRMCKNSYFQAFSQNVDTALGFGNPTFLSGSDIVAIGGHLPAFLAIFSLYMGRNSYF